MTDYVKRFGVTAYAIVTFLLSLSDNIESRRLVLVEDLERNPCWCLEISLCFKKKLSMSNSMILSMILQKILVSEIGL